MKRNKWYKNSFKKKAGSFLHNGLRIEYNMVGSYYKGDMYSPPEYPEAEIDSVEIEDEDEFAGAFIEDRYEEMEEILSKQNIIIEEMNLKPQQIGIQIDGLHFVFRCPDMEENDYDIVPEDVLSAENLVRLDGGDGWDPDIWIETLNEMAEEDAKDYDPF